jgi:hypothetical protein
MADFNLECLVLRGVAVLSDGSAVSLRLGTGYAAEGQAPAGLFMRHPSLGWDQGFPKPDVQRPHQADLNRVVRAANGAGRSRSRTGVLRRSAAMAAPKPAAATTLRPCWTRLQATARPGERGAVRGITIR